ncbi:hypothetical protein EDF31_107189 [Curtobacterium sp. PhB142]|uniref:hypothetical protein n=1 Tax=unclassified Curtobacterium TaxID=257496 RepID=UPI0010457451|nr:MULTISPECIES: hypothetical protein [unclassified Curtobacterium]TCL83495.1 hypothetical protein EDF31_107189 [Curtobacterium sp. PhB142]TCM01016.1 hypothetical protein EDF26_107189 [Curtobacterium sp. PhB134]
MTQNLEIVPEAPAVQIAGEADNVAVIDYDRIRAAIDLAVSAVPRDLERLQEMGGKDRSDTLEEAVSGLSAAVAAVAGELLAVARAVKFGRIAVTNFPGED